MLAPTLHPLHDIFLDPVVSNCTVRCPSCDTIFSFQVDVNRTCHALLLRLGEPGIHAAECNRGVLRKVQQAGLLQDVKKRTCIENTSTVVWPRSERSFSLDSARSEADAAATGNSPPQPKPKSACAPVKNAKTTYALGPSAAVRSTPAAHHNMSITT